MKAFQTDDGEIRFYFDKREIAVHNLRFSDFITPSSKSAELLQKLLRYAHERFGFHPSGDHLTIGAVPLDADHLMLTLSDHDITGKFPGVGRGNDRATAGNDRGDRQEDEEDTGYSPEPSRSHRAPRRSDPSLPDDSDFFDDPDLDDSLNGGVSDTDDELLTADEDAISDDADTMNDRVLPENIYGNTQEDIPADVVEGDMADILNDSSAPSDNVRTFLRYLRDFLASDDDSGSASGASGNDSADLPDITGPETDSSAARSADEDGFRGDASPAGKAADSRADADTATESSSRVREGSSKKTGDTPKDEGSVFNYTKIRNLITFAEIAKPLRVDSLLLYDDVEHCYHLCLRPLPDAAADYTRACHLAAEYGIRAVNPSIRYYCEQFPCIASEQALEMLRSL